MKIEFLDYLKYKKQSVSDGLHVLLVNDETVLKNILTKSNWTFKHDTMTMQGKQMMMPSGRRMMFYMINDDSLFLDMKDVTNALGNDTASNGDTLYIIMNSLSSEMKPALITMLAKNLYTFSKYKTNATSKQHKRIFMVDKGVKEDIYNIFLDQVHSGNIARDLATEPANQLSPESFCYAASKILRANKRITFRCMNAKEMRKVGLNLVLGVGNSSANEPKFLLSELKSKRPGAKTICLVGKGVIFDSGGYDLKVSGSMKNMKGDKTGGAVVIGMMDYFASNKKDIGINLVAVVPLVENMVSGKAYKTGDVIKAYNGMTVEILNTDAEGRLILADALAYSIDKYNPDYVFDFATLTGWSKLLHCDISYSFFTLNDNLASLVTQIGESVGEKSVRIPPWIEYLKVTKSEIADVKNANYTGCPGAGGFTASLFLANFIKKKTRANWIHFDITHNMSEELAMANGFATGVNLIHALVV